MHVFAECECESLQYVASTIITITIYIPSFPLAKPISTPIFLRIFTSQHISEATTNLRIRWIPLGCLHDVV